MKSLMIKSKWLLRQCKSVIPYLILIIVLGLLTSTSSVYKAVVTKNLIDSSTSGNIYAILTPLIILGSLIIGDLIVNYVFAMIKTYCSTKLTNTIQKKLYTHITYCEWAEGSKYHSGDLISRIISDTSSITNFIVNTIPNIISLLFTVVSSFIILLSYEPIVALLTITIAPIALIFSKIYGKKLKSIHLSNQENEAEYLSYMQESIKNRLIVKTFCLETHNIQNFSNIQNKRINLSLSRSSISTLYSSTINFGYWVTYFLIFCLGSFRISNGTLTFGTLTALIQLSINVQAPLSDLASSLSQFITAYASTERLMVIEGLTLETASKIKNGQSIFMPPIIEYKNVSFGYENSLPILKDISFNLYPGEVAALVGPSGEGKTTLIRLLLSLIKPKSGAIKLINNNENIVISPDTRHHISYVPQGNTLFSGTIADNLRYGFLEATDKDIEKALKAACAWDFVDDLPDKTETVIGEHGTGVSEGQAQRLVIARALIRRKSILILDEATSALDMDTEVKVLKSIKNLDYHPTCIIITHRPTALAICNRILKLSEGTIQEVYENSIEESALSIL
ncbi:MAG: ABC transporter ATP-binding protein [Clostridiaceae bacterium]